ncbi:NAD(P)H-dependent oxidoreductase [Lichenihabitans sp. Uapishka_5]|uniref:FMN-dependent NADH-azoreductase n=1 Tax=Lichenihabitans sp. Uapishka_5 TaxID=3037302 RepID=UPI0029E8134F|nr:NAD(P)H-dependent oxidoreductase [Lichenihabitans sp. Uapishka_5]MDX7953715.1 NAD(P)H-dependent oxidoreductase [Lichenihabitans sp. Uapishka_5]
MTKLLVVETSPRGPSSISRTMTRHFLDAWHKAHPDGAVVTRDLAETDLPFVTAAWIQAMFTPTEHRTPAMQAEMRVSDELVAEVLAADHIVIATPVYNYNVPATLKAWIDQIVRKGIVLGPDGEGTLGGKKATLLIASGGNYAEGSPIRDRDIATQYLRVVLDAMGITDVTVVAGGGAKAVDMRETTMDAFLGTLGPAIEGAAA